MRYRILLLSLLPSVALSQRASLKPPSCYQEAREFRSCIGVQLAASGKTFLELVESNPVCSESLVNDYTKLLYKPLNFYLIQKQMHPMSYTTDKVCEELEVILKMGLARLPKVAHVTVFSGQKKILMPQVFKEETCYKPVVFLSTSLDVNICYPFTHPTTPIIFDISLLEGPQVWSLSAKANEQEVLLVPGTLLKYERSYKDGNSRLWKSYLNNQPTFHRFKQVGLKDCAKGTENLVTQDFL